MTAITDPNVGFLSYKQALREGTISPQRCDAHPHLFVMSDQPQKGVHRLTYTFITGKKAKAYAVFLVSDPIEGKPCFGVGYATDEAYRNQGLATKILKASIKEMRDKLAPRLQKSGFYIEAIVGLDNLVSQKVAARVLQSDPKQTIDSASGLPALHYVKYFA